MRQNEENVADVIMESRRNKCSFMKKAMKKGKVRYSL